MKELVKKLAKIQKELKAPKSQRNKFGNFNYRNQEDILEAVKPLLGELVLTVSDEMVQIGERIYVKATSTITDGSDSISNTAYAREPEEQKGMAEPMLTGSTSSYARKYSLNGLFLIDDTKDPDTNEFGDVTGKTEKAEAPKKFGSSKPSPEKEEVKQEAKPASRFTKTAPVKEEKEADLDEALGPKEDVAPPAKVVTKPASRWQSKRTGG